MAVSALGLAVFLSSLGLGLLNLDPPDGPCETVCLRSAYADCADLRSPALNALLNASTLDVRGLLGSAVCAEAFWPDCAGAFC